MKQRQLCSCWQCLKSSKLVGWRRRSGGGAGVMSGGGTLCCLAGWLSVCLAGPPSLAIYMSHGSGIISLKAAVVCSPPPPRIGRTPRWDTYPGAPLGSWHPTQVAGCSEIARRGTGDIEIIKKGVIWPAWQFSWLVMVPAQHPAAEVARQGGSVCLQKGGRMQAATARSSSFGRHNPLHGGAAAWRSRVRSRPIPAQLHAL